MERRRRVAAACRALDAGRIEHRRTLLVRAAVDASERPRALEAVFQRRLIVPHLLHFDSSGLDQGPPLLPDGGEGLPNQICDIIVGMEAMLGTPHQSGESWPTGWTMLGFMFVLSRGADPLTRG